MDDVRPISLVAAGVIPPPRDTDAAVRQVRSQRPIPQQAAQNIAGGPKAQASAQAPAYQPSPLRPQAQTAAPTPTPVPALSDADTAKMDTILGKTAEAPPAPGGLSATELGDMDKVLGRGPETPRYKSPTAFGKYGEAVGQIVDAATVPIRQVLSGNPNPIEMMDKMKAAADRPSDLAETVGPVVRDVQALSLGGPITKAKGVVGGALRAAEQGAKMAGITYADTYDAAKSAIAGTVGTVLGAAGELVPGAVGKVIDYTKLNTKEYQRVGAEKATELMDWAKKNVPAFSKLEDGAKGLYDAIHTTKGAEALQAAYDKTIRSVRSVIPQGRLVDIPIDVAKKIGVKGAEAEQAVKEVPEALRKQLGLKPGEIPDYLKAQGYGVVKKATDVVSADLRAVVGKLQDIEQMGVDAARSAEASIVRGVRNVSRDAAKRLQVARAQHAAGTALRDFGQAGGGMFDDAGRFDPVKAQAVLKKAGESAVGAVTRGAKAAGQAVEDVVKKGGEIVARNLSPWERRLKGAELGGAIGSVLPGPGSHILGIPGGVIGGLAGPSVIPPTLYKGGPLRSGAERVVQAVGPLANRGRAAARAGVLGLLRSAGLIGPEQQ